MDLTLDDTLRLSPLVHADRHALVEHLNNPKIHDNTLQIPYPYTLSDADEWLQGVGLAYARHGPAGIWAVREATGRLIGSVALRGGAANGSFKDELGYWLAEPWWGRGIMTRAVRAVVAYGVRVRGLVRIEAPVFAHNAASARVLSKASFAYEGRLRKYYRKGGRYVDALLYAYVT